MLSSAVAGTCQQCKKGRALRPKNPVDALINLHIQTLHDLGRNRIATKKQLNLVQSRPYSSTLFQTQKPTWNRIPTFGRTYASSSSFEKPKPNPQTSHDAVLSAALGQSDASTVHALIDIAFQMLHKKKPSLAWECYSDISAKGGLGYLSNDQFKHLIKHFSNTTHRGQGLEYVLTLIEDMQNMGYRVGRKEKMIVLRLLATRGKIDEMQDIFRDVTKDDCSVLDPVLPVDPAVLRPYAIVLAAYEEHHKVLGKLETAKRSMEVYGSMIDRGLRPSESTTRILLENIRRGADDAEVVEYTWTWLWERIGKDIGGSGHELDPLLYKNMILFFASVGRPDYGLEINDIMRKKKIPRDVRVMTALIHKVGRMGDIEHAMELLDEMKTVEKLVPNTITLNALIDIHVHKRPEPDLSGAIRSYRMFAEQGLQPNDITFGTLIDMFAKKGDVDRVRDLYQDMVHTHHIKPTNHIFSSLIECFITQQDFVSALSVVKLMRQGPVNVEPNQVNFNLLINSFADSNDIKSAVLLLKALMTAGIKPTAQTYHPILAYYARRGRVEDVKKLIQKMHTSNIKLEPITYCIFLDAYSKAGNVNGAENLFKKYKERWRPNPYTFNSMMYVYILKNDLDKVLDIYKEMIRTTVKMTAHSYGLLMYCYSLRQEPDAAEALMETMKANDITPTLVCWNILLQTYFKTNQPNQGQDIMDRMAKEGVVANFAILSTYIDGLTKTGNIEVAENVLESALARYEERLGLTKNGRDLAMLSDTSPNSNQAYVSKLPETIEDLLRSKETENKSVEPLSSYMFVPLIQHYTKSGRFDRAKELFVRMRDLGVPLNNVVYVAMMKLYLEAADVDRVQVMWNALESPSPEQKHVDPKDPELGLIPLPQSTSRQYPIDLLPFYEYTQDVDNSTNDLLENIDEPKMVPRFALSVYMDSLDLQGRFDDIDDLWKDLTNKGYRFDEHNWNQYVGTLVKTNRLLEACQAINDKLIEADEREVKSSLRKGEFSEVQDTSISLKTCRLLVDALEIPGADGMGREILRKNVVERVRGYLRGHKLAGQFDSNTSS
ncbi:hypothetical protein CLU79DRAFT_749177 [Phycomyces nitens]|nr:hypothetical protein CLU79DRAFT_749177 [Phycomyces nitens]